MHKLPPLPYEYDALEPFIDEATLKVHHDGHHATYVKKLNKALKAYPKLQKLPIEELLASLDELPEKIRKDVRNNGGGHYNHSLMWKVIGPPVKSHLSEKLSDAIDEAFGSFDDFKAKFSKRAEKLFGSGYVWLCADAKGTLIIKSLPNQDCPLTKGLKPLFLMDLWEHAYYLKHQNRRPEYIETFWNLLNWDEISQRYDE